MTKTKINLLSRSPGDNGNGRRPPRKPFRPSIFVLFFAFIMIGFEIAFLWTFYQTIARKETTSTNAFKKITLTVNTLKQRVSKLKSELTDISKSPMPSLLHQIQSDSSHLVSVLSTLSENLPSKAWISHIAQDGQKIKITGYASEHSTISTFLSQLESSDLFKNVALIVAEQNIKEDLELKKFTILCEVNKI